MATYLELQRQLDKAKTRDELTAIRKASQLLPKHQQEDLSRSVALRAGLLAQKPRRKKNGA